MMNEIIEDMLLKKRGFRETILNDKPITKIAQSHLNRVNIEIRLLLEIKKQIEGQN